MPKPTEIVDFLLNGVDGLDRRDLEARLKFMRAEGLWPAARRVDEREAEFVTEEHCTNLILGLIGSNTATGAPAATKAFSGLPYLGKTEVVDQAILFLTKHDEIPQTLGEFLARTIRSWRGETRPVPDYLDTGDLLANHGDPCSVTLAFRDIGDAEPEPDKVVPYGFLILFGEQQQPLQRPRMKEHRSVNASIIGVMAEFLGPTEDDAA